MKWAWVSFCTIANCYILPIVFDPERWVDGWMGMRFSSGDIWLTILKYFVVQNGWYELHLDLMIWCTELVTSAVIVSFKTWYMLGHLTLSTYFKTFSSLFFIWYHLMPDEPGTKGKAHLYTWYGIWNNRSSWSYPTKCYFDFWCGAAQDRIKLGLIILKKYVNQCFPPHTHTLTLFNGRNLTEISIFTQVVMPIVLMKLFFLLPFPLFLKNWLLVFVQLVASLLWDGSCTFYFAREVSQLWLELYIIENYIQILLIEQPLPYNPLKEHRCSENTCTLCTQVGISQIKLPALPLFSQAVPLAAVLINTCENFPEKK